MDKKRSHLLIWICVFILLFLLGCIGLYIISLPPKIISVNVSEELNDDNTLTLSIKFISNSNKNYCILTESDEIPSIYDLNWKEASNNKCSYNVNAGNYYVYVKDSKAGISSYGNKNVEINRILAINTDVQEIYVAKGGNMKVNANLVVLGNIDNTIKWKSSDENILTVSDGIINGINNGDAVVTAIASDGKTSDISVHVTDLIHAPIIEEKKTKLKCRQYSTEDAHVLDKILANRVSNAGEGTRAGVVAAARFLALEFPYRVEYFFENGRLNNYGYKSHVDGEGRYFHKGLYLSEDKFKDIEASKSGPAIWGCPLTNWQDESYYKPGVKYPNGLDCSGFVTWALYNGGMDIKDSGAGASPYRDDDMDDLGEKVTLTKELMNSHRIQAGDLIGRDGHIAIVLGINDTNIYVVESLIGGVKVVTRTYESVLHDYNYKYVMLMDSEYSGEGNGFSNMW